MSQGTWPAHGTGADHGEVSQEAVLEVEGRVRSPGMGEQGAYQEPRVRGQSAAGRVSWAKPCKALNGILKTKGRLKF